MMATKMQIVVDSVDPARLVEFWSTALHYVVEPAPGGYPTWREYWLSIGIPESELDEGECADSIIDPDGVLPRIWFQIVPEPKSIKNRLHLDLGVSGGRTVPIEIRRPLVDAEVARLVELGATPTRVHAEPGVDHYAVTLQDPEGNEFCVH